MRENTENMVIIVILFCKAMILIYLKYLLSAKFRLPDLKHHVTEIQKVQYLLARNKDAKRTMAYETKIYRFSLKTFALP